MDILIVVLAIVAGILFLGWLGLQIPPSPFPAYQRHSNAQETMPLPPGLPAPVESFYRRLYGEQMPVITSAVISGRGRLRLNDLIFPVRFRFTHDAGKAYRHYIEATIFGLPFMKVNEGFLDGAGRMELPFGVVEGPKVDQGGNLALWAESVWLPSLWITDRRAEWRSIDRDTALLTVPFKEEKQSFVVRFSPATGLLHLMESMRYKGAEAEEKILWLNEVLRWGPVDDHTIPTLSTVTWFDEKTPWAVFQVEEIIYNTDVKEYIRAKGP